MPSGLASCDASQGPTIAPSVPPTAITPKSRLLCSSENRSAMSAQNTIVANRLKTLNQTKNTIPLTSPTLAGADEERVEAEQAEGEEEVGGRDEDEAPVAAHEQPEQRVHRQGDDGGPDEEPAHRLDPAPHAERLARRARSTMRAVRMQKKSRPGDHGRRRLVAPDVRQTL